MLEAYLRDPRNAGRRYRTFAIAMAVHLAYVVHTGAAVSGAGSSAGRVDAIAVDGNEEVMAAAFYVQRDFPVVTNDDRTDVEAVRSYRGNGDRIGMRNDDRAAYA